MVERKGHVMCLDLTVNESVLSIGFTVRHRVNL